MHGLLGLSMMVYVISDALSTSTESITSFNSSITDSIFGSNSSTFDVVSNMVLMTIRRTVCYNGYIVSTVCILPLGQQL